MLIAFSVLLVTLPLLWLRRRQLAGTTLGSMCWWLCGTICAIAVVECWLAISRPASETIGLALQFGAASLSFCPTMSVLGAKRPQDKAWNFIVLSLWVVLVLPALEAVTLHLDQPFDLSTARSWFVLVLIVVCAANRVGTRGTLAGLVFAAAQLLLFAPYLPLGIDTLVIHSAGGGLSLLSLAIGIDVVNTYWGRPGRHGWDRLWLDFRDTFGTLWALRVAERINAASEICDWQLRLAWGGFRFENADSQVASTQAVPLDDETQASLRTTTANLLRRFVTNEWMHARLEVVEGEAAELVTNEPPETEKP